MGGGGGRGMGGGFRGGRGGGGGGRGGPPSRRTQYRVLVSGLLPVNMIIAKARAARQ